MRHRQLRCKDGVKQSLKTCEISPNELNSAPLAQASWRSRCQDVIDEFEVTRVGAMRSGKLGELLQSGRQDSGQVTVAVASVNP